MRGLELYKGLAFEQRFSLFEAWVWTHQPGETFTARELATHWLDNVRAPAALTPTLAKRLAHSWLKKQVAAGALQFELPTRARNHSIYWKPK